MTEVRKSNIMKNKKIMKIEMFNDDKNILNFQRKEK